MMGAYLLEYLFNKPYTKREKFLAHETSEKKSTLKGKNLPAHETSEKRSTLKGKNLPAHEMSEKRSTLKGKHLPAHEMSEKRSFQKLHEMSEKRSIQKGKNCFSGILLPFRVDLSRSDQNQFCQSWLL